MRTSLVPLLVCLVLLLTLLPQSSYQAMADTRSSTTPPAFTSAFAQNPSHSGSSPAQPLAALDTSIRALVMQYAQQGLHAGIVISDDTGESIAVNADDRFTIASLYKLFVLWKIQAEIEAGHLTDQTPLTLTKENDQSDMDGSKLGPYGSTITVDEARRLMITQSNNTAAWVLATWVGWNNLNAYLSAHGFTSTWEETTPREVARFFQGIANRSLDPALKQSDYTLMLNLLKHQQIPTPLSLGLPPDAVFAHKTGHLDKVDHDAGLLFMPDGRVFAIAVLTTGDNAEGQALMGDVARIISEQLLAPPPVNKNPSIPGGLELPNGLFYRAANGKGGEGTTGYAIVNSTWSGVSVAPVKFYDEFLRLGNVAGVGYPASWPFVLNGFVSQVMQKGVIQWRPEVQRIYFVNVFDELHDRGLDTRLYVEMQVPRMADWSGDTGKSWDTVVARHMAMLDYYPQMRATYYAIDNPIEIYGLPMSPVVDFGPFYAVRLQRAVFQQYKIDTAYAHKGDVMIANGGDVAKQMGLIPAQASIPYGTPNWSSKIMVFNPSQNDTVGRTIKVSGNAQVDAAQLRWEVRTSNGAVLKRGTVKAAACCTWAQFSIDIDMTGIPAQPVKLVLLDAGSNTSAGSIELALNYRP